MKDIGSFFLRASHWQLFTLFMGLSFIGVVSFFSSNAPAAGWDVLPLHLSAMFCIFYAKYFEAKSPAMVESAPAAEVLTCIGYLQSKPPKMGRMGFSAYLFRKSILFIYNNLHKPLT
ncbi:MAG TPA: hypothetical protein VFJ52_01015 [Terriglobia bacterium]|nr:hypothetical protein [Terriglobia bacterium]